MRDFQSRYCERFQCSLAEFEERALMHCLPWRARLLAPFIRTFNSEYFEPDKSFIHYLGKATNPSEAKTEISVFTENNRMKGGFARRELRIRVSARKAAILATELFITAQLQAAVS